MWCFIEFSGSDSLYLGKRQSAFSIDMMSDSRDMSYFYTYLGWMPR
jgi:hypothetical protein